MHKCNRLFHLIVRYIPHILFLLHVYRETVRNFEGKTAFLNIPFDVRVFPTSCNITQFIYFWKTALHVSGGIPTHHQEHKQLYLQYLVFVKPLLLPVAVVKEVETGWV